MNIFLFNEYQMHYINNQASVAESIQSDPESIQSVPESIQSDPKSRILSGSSPKSNRLVLVSFRSYLENFIEIRP